MRVWLKQLGVALLYCLVGLLTQQTFKLLGAVSIIWPGSGLALAVLLIGGRRYLWGVFLGSLLLNAIGSDSLWTLGGITLAHVMEALVAFSLCTRYAVPTPSLRTLFDYFKLIILGGAFASTVGAVIGTLSLLLAGYIKQVYLAEIIFHWWMGDTLGVLLVTPLVLSWQQEWQKKIPTMKLLEGLLLIAITFLVGQIVFFDWFREYLSATPKGYLLFLCVSWVAIRMGPRSTTLVLLVIAAQALTSIYYQVGIFSHDVMTANLQNYWAYMLTLSIVGMAVTTSVNELVHTYNALNESEQRYRALFESAGDSIFLIKGEQFIDCNPATLKMFGCTRDLIIGEPPYRFSPELQPDGSPSKEKTLEKIHDALKTETAPFEWQHCRCDGTLFEAEVALSPVKIGEDQYLLASVRDISARKEAEEKIHQLAFYDPLTHLPNRQLLLDRLQQASASISRSGRQGALLFIDLDNFKTLNDTLGHHIGDFLLQQVSERLTSCVREGDTVSRLGGDEFVVMLEDLSEQPVEAAAQSETIGEKILDSLSKPYLLESNEYRCTTSIGVTMFSGSQQTADELLKQADIAMYQAKKAGRNTLRFFDPQMQETINNRAELENDLRKALENHQFRLYYQVQVDNLFRPLGVEALIRWHHPERGLISPAQFIPLAEETGLILPIGQWVLETACAQIKAWEQDARTCELSLAINVSANQFHQADFVVHVQSALQRHAINPKLLKLELTEGLLLKNIEETIATMNALKTFGVRLSLDDFGTGYSSLQYLKKLPLDQIKIDQSFVHDLATDASDKMIVRTIIIMAQSLGLEVIAEGVETDEQQKFLLNNGCTHYQGYFFGKAVTIEEFEGVLKQI